MLELLEKEEDKRKKEADEKKQENQPSEGGDIIESALRSESQKESVEEVTTQPVLTLKETIPAARVASVQVEVGESSVLPKKSGDMEPSSQPSVAKQEVVRVKEQKWTPPEGKRRCNQCSGCQKKCKEQGLEDCSSCDPNKTKGGKNGCFNREECTNLKPTKVKDTKIKSVGKNSILADSLLGDLLQKSPSATSQVGTQIVTFQPGQVESLAKDLEVKGKSEKEEDAACDGKRRRPEGETPPDQKRTSKMPMMKKDAGGSRVLPVKATSLIH